MKQFGILILIICCLSVSTKCFAQSQFSDTITRMEKSLFGVDYSSQSDDARLKRIEQEVYGSTSSKTAQQRLSKLSQDLSVEQMGQEIKPKADTFAEEEDAYKERIPKADSNINYPAVDNLEQSVFNKTFKSNEITSRLTALEKKVFSKSYNDDLNSRVERLKAAVMPERIVQHDDEYNDSDVESYEPKDILSRLGDGAKFGFGGGRPSGYGAQIPTMDSAEDGFDSYSADSDIVVPLADLEKKILKKTYANDVVNNRLLRLEVKVFNSSFTDDDAQTRLDRIASAYQAKKSSSKYDNNKFSQHVSTAMQIGAFLLMILAAVL